jgi:hypothetical protein
MISRISLRYREPRPAQSQLPAPPQARLPRSWLASPQAARVDGTSRGRVETRWHEGANQTSFVTRMRPRRGAHAGPPEPRLSEPHWILLTACSRRTTPAGIGRHQPTQDDTSSQHPCLAAATLGSGARKGVGVRLSPLARPLTRGSAVESFHHLVRAELAGYPAHFSAISSSAILR